MLKEWNSFKQQSSKKDVVISEISKQAIRKINSYFGMQGDKNNLIEKSSFNDLFGNKSRVVIPFDKSSFSKGTEIGKLVKFFKDWGFSVNLSKGTISRTIQTQNGEKVREEKIGKFLNNLVNLITKGRSAYQLYERVSLALRQAYPPNEKIAVLQKEKQIYYKEIENILDTINKIIPSFINFSNFKNNTFLQEFVDMLQFWNSKSEFYIKNPNYHEQEAPYTIVVSRHPIDIVRMGDHDTMRACHSEGREYWFCALAEARDGGLIAYAINNENLKKIFSYKEEFLEDESFQESLEKFLEKEEIFSDQERGISGITPTARLRIRKFDYQEQFYLAVAENRVYGEKIPGFVESVRSYLSEIQKNKIDLIDFEKISPSSFARYGGSYQDTSDTTLLSNFFMAAGIDVQKYNANFSSLENVRYRGKEDTTETTFNHAEFKRDAHRLVDNFNNLNKTEDTSIVEYDLNFDDEYEHQDSQLEISTVFIQIAKTDSLKYFNFKTQKFKDFFLNDKSTIKAAILQRIQSDLLIHLRLDDRNIKLHSVDIVLDITSKNDIQYLYFLNKIDSEDPHLFKYNILLNFINNDERRKFGFGGVTELIKSNT